MSKIWSYLNYAQWGKKYPKCHQDNNNQQSPININRKDVEIDCGLRCQLQLKYQASKCYIVNENNTITIRYEPGSYLLFQNTWYELTKAEIHLPSAHTIDNSHYDMEVNLYHCLDNSCSGGIILALFLNAGSEYGRSANFFSQFINQAPSEKSTVEREVEVSKDWNIADIFPDNMTFYFYNGSEAHPPCSPGWKWIVFDQPSNIGITNYKTLKYNIIEKRGENIRPVQAIGNREITKVQGKYVKILRTTSYKELQRKKLEEKEKLNKELNDRENVSNSQDSLTDSINNAGWKLWFKKNKERIRGLFVFLMLICYFLLAIQITRVIIKNDYINMIFSAQKGGTNTSNNINGNTMKGINNNNMNNMNNMNMNNNMK